MTHAEMAAMRLQNQHIIGEKLKSPQELVSYMGAMQAQDFAMSKWAVASRLEKATEKDIQKALDDGKILRTHLMRPTWHLVAAEDIYWMLALTAPQIKSAMKARNRELGITPELLKKSLSVIEKALENTHLSREDLLAELVKNKIAINESRSSHLLMEAEMESLICSGPMIGNKQSYALIENRTRKTKHPDHNDAIEKLALKYFTSHSPASLEDFVWWSGLPVRDARKGIEAIQKNFVSEEIDSKTYWIPEGFHIPEIKNGTIQLLPSFDEYTISYKDRSAVLEKVHHRKAVSVNGIFSPIVVINGQVAGTWSRVVKKDEVSINVHLFVPILKKHHNTMAQKGGAYAAFLGKNLKSFQIDNEIHVF